jgi:hypothetical protein
MKLTAKLPLAAGGVNGVEKAHLRKKNVFSDLF